MDMIKHYFNSFTATVKANSLGIILGFVLANLFVKFGIGFLLAVGLVSFAIHAIYERVTK